MKHNVTIDRLRGLSVLAVTCMHTLFFFPNALTFLGKSLSNGYFGVTAFFCTSGFLITANMLRRYERVARTDLYAFYVMRFGRIVPPLSLLVLVLFLLSLTAIQRFDFPASLSLKDSLISIVTLRYNLYFQHGGSQMLPWAILWSLSIEEMFYLGYPLMAKIARNTFWLVIVLIGIIIYAPIHRRGDGWTVYDYFGCFDGIALGALSALAAKRYGIHVNKWVAWALMVVGGLIALGTYAKGDVNAHYTYSLTLLAAGTALMLFASQCVPFVNTRPWAYDPLSYLGRLSYEMYLCHMTIFSLLICVFTPSFLQYPKLVFASALLCVVAVSDVVRRFYAEPLNRWLRVTLLSVRKGRVLEPAALQQPVP